MYRGLGSVGVGAVLALATVTVAGQAPAPAKANGTAAKAYTPPKTADGQPDLSGYWTNSTYIPLQRPKGVTKEFYTPEEMDKIEAAAKAREDEQTVPGTRQDVHYDDGQFGLARSQSTYARNLRTSLIVDPPDGQLPPQTEEAVRRNDAITKARTVGTPPPGFTATDIRGGNLDSVHGIKIDTRCLMMAAVPPPLVSPGYLANYQIIQSPGYVTILVERLHDARIIPLDNRPFPPTNVRSWVGVSRGHWEGNTLVVETRNSNGRVQAAAQGPMTGQTFSGRQRRHEDHRAVHARVGGPDRLPLHGRGSEDLDAVLDRGSALRADGSAGALLRARVLRGQLLDREHADERARPGEAGGRGGGEKRIELITGRSRSDTGGRRSSE